MVLKVATQSLKVKKIVGEKMTHHLKIAFDVDDTLVIPAGIVGDAEVPNYDVINVYLFLQRQRHHMIIWSGGGQDYARMQARRLGLEADEIIAKTADRKDEVDIAFDDSDIELAKVNVKVKRINNHIERYPEQHRFEHRQNNPKPSQPKN